MLILFLFGREFLSSNSNETLISPQRDDEISSRAPSKNSRPHSNHKLQGVAEEFSSERIAPAFTGKFDKTVHQKPNLGTNSVKTVSMVQQTAAPLNPLEVLLAKVEEAERLGDYESGLMILKSLKDQSEGEDLQAVLKKLATYGEEGGEEIIDTFLTSQNLPEIERFRMLSYIAEGYQLSYDGFIGLQNSYDQAESSELRSAIIDTIAKSAGNDEINWLINKTADSADFSEWAELLHSLSRTHSEIALQFLHEYLDELTASNSPENEKYSREVREAIKAF